MDWRFKEIPEYLFVFEIPHLLILRWENFILFVFLNACQH